LIQLRSLNLSRDAKALHLIFGDEESCRYMLQPATASVEETQALLQGWHSEHPDLEWALCDEPDGDCLGRIVMIPSGDKVYEVGCTVIPDARGRGLAGQGVALALDVVFDEKCARRIFADIDPDNTASIKTFERLGFKYEGVLRAAWNTHIGVRDSVMMSLIDSDPKLWRQR